MFGLFSARSGHSEALDSVSSSRKQILGEPCAAPLMPLALMARLAARRRRTCDSMSGLDLRASTILLYMEWLLISVALRWSRALRSSSVSLILRLRSDIVEAGWGV